MHLMRYLFKEGMNKEWWKLNSSITKAGLHNAQYDEEEYTENSFKTTKNVVKKTFDQNRIHRENS